MIGHHVRRALIARLAKESSNKRKAKSYSCLVCSKRGYKHEFSARIASNSSDKVIFLCQSCLHHLVELE